MGKVLNIVQCSDPLLWYRQYINMSVPFVYEDSKYYWAREVDGYMNIVYKDDAILQEVEDGCQ